MNAAAMIFPGESAGGGVYMQSEAASLTRDIPIALGWLIGPFITSIPRESLTFTLEATRKAANERSGNSQTHQARP